MRLCFTYLVVKQFIYFLYKFLLFQEKCGEKPKLVALHEKLEQCNERVSSKKQTTETCTEELIDYFHELDHCVAKTLFTKLK